MSARAGVEGDMAKATAKATAAEPAGDEDAPTWVRLRFSPEDHRRVRVAAAKRGRAMARYVRDVVLAAVAESETTA